MSIMLLANFFLLQTASAANSVSQYWINSGGTTCSGAPSYVDIYHYENIDEKYCSSISCYCYNSICYSYNSCSSDSISKIGTSFGSKSHVSVSMYSDTACTVPSTTQLSLADTCVQENSERSFYVSSSGTVKLYKSRDCTGPVDSTCISRGTSSFSTSPSGEMKLYNSRDCTGVAYSFTANVCVNLGSISAKATLITPKTEIAATGGSKSEALGSFASSNVLLASTLAVAGVIFV